MTGPGDIFIQGAVALGTGGITRGAAAADTGTLLLSGDNTYTGATTVSFGTLVAASNNALGSPAGGTTVASGATLGLQGGITVTNEAITITGSGVEETAPFATSPAPTRSLAQSRLAQALRFSPMREALPSAARSPEPTAH